MENNIKFITILLTKLRVKYPGLFGNESNTEIDGMINELNSIQHDEKSLIENIEIISKLYNTTLYMFIKNIVRHNCNDRFNIVNSIISNISLTNISYTSIKEKWYISSFLARPIEDLLYVLWSPDFVKGNKEFKDIKTLSLDLDLYLNNAIDFYNKYSKDKEEDLVINKSILNPRKDITSVIPVFDSSLEFSAIMLKFNLMYIVKFITIILISILVTK